ncbi:hypothetical protein [Nissabacter sp. SGAir0207]|uniref:hypothetical protein n=1 Tax=Nissabacter sp. SGAir0207 TaxID=2126321 RepID=UPI0010CD60E9|nr:hypothetical protein [Nissabacter sp. SGAir0207]QCR38783.1 hypothetical protein C1N62_21910 [Nissabacter sp. SGAir0207]
MIKCHFIPKGSPDYQKGCINVVIVGRPDVVVFAESLLSADYPTFERQAVTEAGYLPIIFRLPRNTLPAFRKALIAVHANFGTQQAREDKREEGLCIRGIPVCEVAREQIQVATALSRNALVTPAQANALAKMCYKMKLLIEATHPSQCVTDEERIYMEKRLNRFRPKMSGLIRYVSLSVREAQEMGEAANYFVDATDDDEHFPQQIYLCPNGRKVSREECLNLSKALWRNVLSCAAGAPPKEGMSKDFAHFMISRYGCMDAYLSARNVGDTSRMKLVVIERALAMLEEIKRHFSRGGKLAEKVAYAKHLEERLDIWVMDVKAYFHRKLVPMAKVSDDLTQEHIDSVIAQLEQLHSKTIEVMKDPAPVLRPQEFFTLQPISSEGDNEASL